MLSYKQLQKNSAKNKMLFHTLQVQCGLERNGKEFCSIQSKTWDKNGSISIDAFNTTKAENRM